MIFDRSWSALHDMWIRKEVGIVVGADMHSGLIDIEDGSSGAIEDVELFVSPNGLFSMWW